MLALVELDYPNPLIAFFEGFEFALLSFPEGWNPFSHIDSFTISSDVQIPLQLSEGGFYSPYFLV